MVLDIGTPALVFPAATLLILAYTHRFAHLSDHIRQFSEAKKINNSEIIEAQLANFHRRIHLCLLYTSPSPRDQRGSRMPSSA